MHFAVQWVDLLTYTKVGQNFFPNSFFILGGAAVFALLCWKVPALASSIVSGGLNLGAADLLGVAAAGGAVAAGGAALGSAVGAAAGSTLKGATQAVAAGRGLAAAQGITCWRGLGAGLGHALQAAGTEAAQGMRAKVGLDKRSEHSVDRYGKEVSNLGTRAANRLDANAQASRETRASTTAESPASAPDISRSDQGSGSDGGQGAKGGIGSSGYADPAAAPAAENESAQEVLSSIAKIKPAPLSSQPHADAGGGQIQDAVRRVKPPQVPHDGGSIEAPAIRLEGDE